MRSRLSVALAVVVGVVLAGVGTAALAGRSSAGTYTLPSGTPFVPGTVISSATMNSVHGDVAQALTDSLDRQGRGPMLAPLRVPSGSVTAPTLSWTNDTDTGLWLVGDANPAMTVAGSKRQEWTSAGSKVTGTFEVTGATTLTGGVTGNVALNQAATQSIAKTGGTLKIEAGGAYEVQFFTGGAQAAAFQTDGDLWMNSHKIQNVADPVAASDAATKWYVDEPIASINSDGTVAWARGFSTSDTGGSGIYTMTFSTPMANTQYAVATSSDGGEVIVNSKTVNGFGVLTTNSAGSTTAHAFDVIVRVNR